MVDGDYLSQDYRAYESISLLSSLLQDNSSLTLQFQQMWCPWTTLLITRYLIHRNLQD